MTSARASHADNPDATDIGAAVPFRSRRSADTSGPVPTTEPTLKSAGLGLLVLSHKMRQDAWEMDRDKALRGNRKEAGRIETEARKATTAVLTKGASSTDYNPLFDPPSDCCSWERCCAGGMCQDTIWRYCSAADGPSL